MNKDIDCDYERQLQEKDIEIAILKKSLYVALGTSRLEEKILEFEIRAELASQMAEALTTKVDKAVFSEINEYKYKGD